MSAALCAAPCVWQAHDPEPCGKPSTHLTYSGAPERLGELRYWRPVCDEHRRTGANSTGIVYAGCVDVYAATPIGGPSISAERAR